MTGAAGRSALAATIDFWRQGGLRLTQPLTRPADAPAALALLLQPDGDVVLTVPRDFGADAGDLAAGRALIGRAGGAMRRIADDGYGGLARSVVRVLDLGLCASSLGAAASVAATGAVTSAAVATLAVPALLTAGRYVCRGAMLPMLQRALLWWVRRRLR